MKKFCAVLAIGMGTAGVAQAESEWEGPYGGVTLAFMSGDNTYEDETTSKFELEGEMVGAFGGYNIFTGRFIAGAEIAFLTGAANEEDFEGQYEYTSLTDFKARVGIDDGDLMPYGVIGASFGTFSVDEDGSDVRNFEETETGILVGVGIEYAIDDEFSVGGEFISRIFDFESRPEADLAEVNATVNSFAIRGAYRF